MKLNGIIGYPVTPFSDDNTINLPVLKQMLDLLIENGCDAIAPLGSTAESAYLEWDEWCLVVKTSIESINKRVPVIIGISELTTDQAINKCQIAQSYGADALMVIPISYWKLTDQEIFEYYQAIAQETTLPIMIYNNPATSGVDMSPELIVRMFNNIANIMMVKESSGDIQRMHKIYELSKGELPFYNGCNPLALEALCAGASGWCTAAPNLLGQLPQQLIEHVKNGELEQAQKSFYQQLPLLRFIVSGGLPKTIKAGLQLKGIAAGAPRKPLTKATDIELNQLKQLLSEIEN
ncbi:dihydrodipicolinate synthase family protein [Acinetobacter baumannii]|uniref:dihydrodipicolinate synthase family protein n=1 Tax=Acinetobacter baumannii TaxID=470 RepID=UPI0022B2B952|nr:dihydrodipicolinate synthase family protein [Acinetobacter baumannii]MDC5427141.1 dihydrodipicolinate synthase family protein [Acinetobacter baumannii]